MGRVRRCDLLGAGVSLRMGFEASKASLVVSIF